MISRTRLLASLEISVGPKIMGLISENMINNVLNVKVLPRFSQWYPKIYEVRIHKEDAIPFRNYSGKITNYGTYRIPKQFDVPWIDEQEDIEWFDIFDYQIGGNDTSDLYTGGNFMLNQIFLSSRANMPHTRSYYLVTFQEPDLLIVDPPQQSHRDFTVQLKANRTLKTIPKNIQPLFEEYFIAYMKFALYHKYKYEGGNQSFGGVDIETKIDDYSSAESDIKELEAIFEKDCVHNPETFQVQCLYQKKG